MSDQDWGKYNSQLADERAQRAKQEQSRLPDIDHEKISENTEADQKENTGS